VDLTIFTILHGELNLLLVRRGDSPFKGRWALPGGFLQVGDAARDQGEDLEQAAQRELAEETGLPIGSAYLEQLYTFGKAYRDPRTRVISVAYYALIRPELAPLARAGSDAADARWHPIQDVEAKALAFDHDRILLVALQRIRGKIDYSPIAFELVPEKFTIAELRAVYEVIKGQSYDPGNFRRRFHRMVTDGIIEATSGKRVTASKPAKLFRFVRPST
jgi:8-oxo-dGTP diphosphatase